MRIILSTVLSATISMQALATCPTVVIANKKCSGATRLERNIYVGAGTVAGILSGALLGWYVGQRLTDNTKGNSLSLVLAGAGSLAVGKLTHTALQSWLVSDECEKRDQALEVATEKKPAKQLSQPLAVQVVPKKVESKLTDGAKKGQTNEDRNKMLEEIRKGVKLKHVPKKIETSSPKDAPAETLYESLVKELEKRRKRIQPPEGDSRSSDKE